MILVITRIMNIQIKTIVSKSGFVIITILSH